LGNLSGNSIICLIKKKKNHVLSQKSRKALKAIGF